MDAAVRFPRCFPTREAFRLWRDTDSVTRSCSNFCTDCTPQYQAEMIVAFRCEHPFTIFVRDKDGFWEGRRGGWAMGLDPKVNPAYTSQRCSVCGHVHRDNRHGKSFVCLACGHTEDADVNAAKNILAAGLAVLAGAPAGSADVEDAAQSGRPRKRQPANAKGDAPCAV